MLTRFHFSGYRTAQTSSPLSRSFAALSLLCCGFACLGLVHAQGPGRPGGPGGGGPGGRTGFPGDRGPGSRGDAGGNLPGPGNRNPLQQGPGGRWWDEGKYARNVGLTNDQQRRMDSVFLENRTSLITGLDNLHRAQSRLETASKTDHPSEAVVLAEIQNVAQARADLEKANTHMLLQLRNEMTQEQINKLEKLK